MHIAKRGSIAKISSVHDMVNMIIFTQFKYIILMTIQNSITHIYSKSKKTVINIIFQKRREKFTILISFKCEEKVLNCNNTFA